MAATKDDLRRWFQEGVTRGERYMVVMVDHVDFEDFPEYTRDHSHALHLIAHPGQSLRVMEVYDLAMDMEAQMAEHRAWHL